MTIKRTEFTYFFVESAEIEGDTVRFSTEESRHIVKVSRLKASDRIYATDGQGKLFDMEIETADASCVVARIISTAKPERYPFECALGIPATSGQKLDMIVEKVTELGVARLSLFDCESSKCRVPSKKKLERLERVAVSALKQSMRVKLPKIDYVGNLQSLIESSDSYDLVLFGDTEESALRVRHAVTESRPKSVLVMVGPEAGFTVAEIKLLKESGAVAVRLGDHRLRMETAAIALASVVIDALFDAHSL